MTYVSLFPFYVLWWSVPSNENKWEPRFCDNVRAKNNHLDHVQAIMSPFWPCLMSLPKQRDKNPPQNRTKTHNNFPYKCGMERTLNQSKSEQMCPGLRWHHVVPLWKSHMCLMFGTCKRSIVIQAAQRKGSVVLKLSGCLEFVFSSFIVSSATPATFWTSVGWRDRDGEERNNRSGRLSVFTIDFILKVCANCNYSICFKYEWVWVFSVLRCGQRKTFVTN